MIIRSINPATGHINGEFETVSAADAVKAAREVRRSFREWKALPIEQRAELIRNLAAELSKNRDEFARLITIEMGKPISESLGEIDSCARLCLTVANNAKQWLAEEPISTEFRKSYVSFEPLGLIFVIMPWNYPFSQVLRCAVPALAAGNVVLVRHSNSVPLCSIALERAFKVSGFPDVFRTIITDHSAVPRLIRSSFVDGVSITGGSEAGRSVGKLAAQQIKKTVLELGGSNAFIVLEDCDVKLAAKNAIESRIKTGGQACTSSKRFIVVNAVAESFVREVIELAKGVVPGDPLDPATRLGPLANAQQVEKIDGQVKDAITNGATLNCGGKRHGTIGNFYELTILTGVKRNMRVMKEEVFGPVMPIITVKNEEAAIRLGNESNYGLGASIWTKDIGRGERLAAQIEAGMACINRLSNSDQRMPFGGIKKSGIGREFSRYGILEFVNIKSVIVSD